MSVEEDMFYERRRKELLTSTTEATRKVEVTSIATDKVLLI